MITYFRLGKRSHFPWIFLVLAVAVNAGIYALVPQAKAFELYFPVTTAIASFVYFLYSQHHQGTQLFVNLFKEFNARYDSLNGKLDAIIERESADLSAEERKVLFDYFNLCAEEHLFYEAGYVDETVWCAWLCGMKYFAKDAAVLKLWKDEIRSGSYYHFRLSLLENAKCPNNGQ